MDVLQIIQSVGFPIAAVIGCAWFIKSIVMRDKDEAKAREDRYNQNITELMESLQKATDAINKSNELNQELTETNKMLVNEMTSKLNMVDSKVDKILTVIKS